MAAKANPTANAAIWFRLTLNCSPHVLNRYVRTIVPRHQCRLAMLRLKAVSRVEDARLPAKFRGINYLGLPLPAGSAGKHFCWVLIFASFSRMRRSLD